MREGTLSLALAMRLFSTYLAMQAVLMQADAFCLDAIKVEDANIQIHTCIQTNAYCNLYRYFQVIKHCILHLLIRAPTSLDT